MSEHDLTAFPPPPEHPYAATVEGQLQAVRVLIDRWIWEVFASGALSVTVRSGIDGTTVRAVVSDTFVELDAVAGLAPLDAFTLATLLMHNHSRNYKARAVTPANGWVPIYVTARFPAGDRDRLGAHVWDAFEEAFRWRGEINRHRERLEAQQGILPGPTAQA